MRASRGCTGAGLGLVAALVASLLVAPPATASPPTCDVGYAHETLRLRADKPYRVELGCYSYYPLAEEDLAFDVVAAPGHGTLGPVSWDAEIGFHVATYDPTDGYVGTDRMILSVSDGTSSSDIVVDIELTPNTPPDCNDPEVRYGDTPVGEPYTWTIPCWDFDLQDMDLDPALADGPAHGSAVVGLVEDFTGDNLSVTYTPDPGYVGTDTFTAGVSDGDLEAQVEFRVFVADAPWCFGDGPRQVRAGDSDSVLTLCSVPHDGSEWELRVVDPPGQGAVTVDGPRLHYLADPAGSGSDSFTYQIFSAAGEGNIVSQEFAILPNAAPACEPHTATLAQGGQVTVPLSCTDVDADPITIVVGDGPDHGSLGQITDGQVAYTPDPGFAGVDTFTYTAADYARISEPATVTITVTEEDAPVIGLIVRSAQSPARVARSGLRLVASTDEAVDARIRVAVSGRTAERLGLVRRASGSVRIGSLARDLPAGETAVRAELTARAARAIRSVRRVTVVASYAAQDVFGNRTRTSQTVTLRRS